MSASAEAPPLRRLLAYLAPHRPRVIWASVCSVANKLFDLAPEILIGAAVDVVVRQQDSFLADLGVQDVRMQLWLLAAVTFVVWLCESLFQYLYDVAWRNLAQTVEHELRIDAYGHIQELDLAWFEARSSGGLLALLSDDINQLERFLDRGANEILQVITTVVVIGALFFVLAPEVAGWAMLPMPVVIWGSITFQKRLAPRYEAVRAAVEALSARLGTNLGGIVTIKAYTAEAHEVARVTAESEAYRQANAHAIALSASFIPLIRVLILIGFTATLVIGGMQTLEGQLSVATYSVLVFITQRLLWPLTRLGETLDLYQRAMASTTRVMRLLDTPVAADPGDVALPRHLAQGHVQFQEVSFAYTPGTPVLQRISFDVPAGQTAAFVGSTGSGKSTLVKLLLRLYEPDAGRITFDGQSIDRLRVADLRGAIGLVSQEVFLFHGTVHDNIAYGAPRATEAQVIAAAQAAEAHDFIQALPERYATIVGERGQKLSGGQRQRIALARAILRDPAVLVLDEATSAVDNETEVAIQRSLHRITRDRTTLVVAHRLSTVRHAHRIHVVDAGQIVESGTHDELLAADGIYAGLWRVQTGEQIPT